MGVSMVSILRLGGLGARACDALWRRARSGNGIWLGAAIMLSGARLLMRLSRREREVVFRSELAPGEQLTIRHLPASGEGGGSVAEGA